MITENIQELHRMFIGECKSSEGCRPATIDAYRNTFKRLVNLMPEIDINSLNSVMLTKFFEKMDGVKLSTIATYRGKLNKFFEWLVIKGKIKESPFKTMKYPNVHYEDIRFLTKEEIEKIFVAINYNIKWGSDLRRKRNNTIASISLCCGLRKGEILKLSLNDISLDRKEVTIRSEISKSKRRRVIPLNEKILGDLKEYLKERNKLGYTTPYLFVSSQRDAGLTNDGVDHVVDKIKKYSGIKDFHMHRLRHTFGMNLSIGGMGVAQIGQLMGHTNLKSTLPYLRCVPTDTMRDDVERLSDFNNLY